MALNDPVDWREPAREPGAPEGQTPCFALMLSGGVALGAFEAGAYAALHARRIVPEWIAGSSIGAINGAIIVGSPPERRIANLRQRAMEEPIGREAVLGRLAARAAVGP